VKGSGRGRQLAELFLYRNAPQSNEGGRFASAKMRSGRFKTFFAWQNGCDYRQWVLI